MLCFDVDLNIMLEIGVAGGRPGSEECFRPGRHVNDLVGVDTIGSTLKNQFAGNLAIGESEVYEVFSSECVFVKQAVSVSLSNQFG